MPEKKKRVSALVGIVFGGFTIFAAFRKKMANLIWQSVNDTAYVDRCEVMFVGA